MDPNNPQTTPQPNTTPYQQPADNSIYGQPFNPNDHKGSNKKLSIIIIVVLVATLIIFGILTILVTTAYNGIQQRAKIAEKTSSSQQSISNANIKLVKREVSSEGKTASILVPEKWTSANSRYGSTADNTTDTFSDPEITFDNKKALRIRITATGVSLPTSISEDIFQRDKTSTLLSEEMTMRTILESMEYTNCDLQRADYPGLTGRSYGSIYKYTCDYKSNDQKKTLKLQGVQAIVHQADGVYVEFQLENTDPNKLDQATIDEIEKSLKIIEN